MFNVTEIFATLTALSMAVIGFSEFVDRFWKLVDVAAQVRTLVFGVIFGSVGAYFALGMFSVPDTCGTNAWYVCGPLTGFVSGLIGNFAFVTPLVKFILEYLKIRPKE